MSRSRGFLDLAGSAYGRHNLRFLKVAAETNLESVSCIDTTP